MACPYFLPDAPDPAGNANGRPNPPLGRNYVGRCLSDRAREPLPLERCNLGYARGMACFGMDCEADASRFSIGQDNGDTISVRWCIERDYRPVRWGEAKWKRSAGGFQEGFDNPVFHQQIAAYVASYLAAGERSPNG